MTQKPTPGRIVLVRTPEPINSQAESAAIVTQVVNGDYAVNVMLMPGVGQPFPVPTVYPEGHPYAAAYTWRWPERV